MMYRLLVTGYRKFWHPQLIATELDKRLASHQHDLELVMFEFWEGPELQAQDWVRTRRKEGHKIAMDLWPINARANGRRPDPRLATGMVESGIDECLAFVDSHSSPAKLGGMLGVAPLCEARHIPTTRFGRTWAPEAVRPRAGGAKRRLPEGTYSDKLVKRTYG
jgi:hypothetical protein